MIISKTPLRISFVGGGSDLKNFFQYETGAVVSVTIDKYVYINANKRFDDSVRVSYSKTENVESVEMIKHRLVKTVLEELNINNGIEITSIADVPSKGTGLGSSSSFTVGLLNALYSYQNKLVNAEYLAKEASRIEIDVLKEPIGKQDQYASAYGGLNFIQFNPDGNVTVCPISCSRETKDRLNKNLLVFYTGIQRSASALLRKQVYNLKKNKNKFDNLIKMVKIAYFLKKELENNMIDFFGEMLHENWMLKKQLNNEISNPSIDQCYEKARKCGALGGKILGAGGGGFLLFYAPSEKHKNIIDALPKLKHVKINLTNEGSKIVFTD